MSQWPDTRILDLLGIELPIIEGPMAGATTSAMVIAACNAGGLGSMPAAMLSIEQLREELNTIRQHTQRPFNVNFFCHQPPPPDEQRAREWKNLLEPYYRELGVDFDAPTPVSNRAPFDNAACEVIEEFRPAVVSFHFGLPEKSLLDRVKATGRKFSPQRLRSKKPSGWSSMAAMRSLRWVTRLAATGACSSVMT